MAAKLADILGDKLPDNLKNRKHTIEVGNVYLNQMDWSDGLTVKDHCEKKTKYFIVLGFDSQGNVYGGVLISSEPPKNISRIILLYQLLIKSKNNPFLKRDSYINCTHIFPANPHKLNDQTLIGTLHFDDLCDVLRAVLDPGNISITPKERKIYNIQLPEDL